MTRRRRWLLIAAGALVVLFVGARFAANDVLWSRIAASIHEKYGVDVEIDDFALSLLAGEATVSGVRVTDGGKPLIEAESVEMSAAVADVVVGTYDFKKLVVRGLAVHAVVETPDRTNLRRIYDGRRTSAGPGDFVRFRVARIVDGDYFVEDAVTDPARPTRLHLSNVTVGIADLQVSGKPRSAEFGDVRLDAFLAQDGFAARVSAVAWALPWTGKPTFAAHAAVTGLDLGQLPQYVSASTRGWLGGDVMHLAATMRAKDGVIEDGAVVGVVVATGTALPMRFGGTFDDPVFDERSGLADVFHFGFARLGRVAVVGDIGTGVVDAGGAVVGGAVDVVGAMARLDPLGAVEVAGGGVVRGAAALGRGVVNAAKRLLGGDSPAEGDDARVDAAFAALHAERRRAMLDAALASATGGPSARRRRIEAETAAQSR